MPLSRQEHAALTAYDATIHEIIRDAVAAFTDAGRRIGELPDGFDDAGWREEMAATSRALRIFVDRLPAEPPVMARGLHVRILRWFGAVAETGEALGRQQAPEQGGSTIGWVHGAGAKGHEMPRHQQAREEGDDSFREEPRYERLLQRTEVERTWIYELRPDLKHKISTYLAAKAAARNQHVGT